jgi:hypothetical protein
VSVSSKLTTHKHQHAISKILNAVFADRAAQAPFVSLSKRTTDMLLHPYPQALFYIAGRNSEANILLASNKAGNAINCMSSVTAGFADTGHLLRSFLTVNKAIIRSFHQKVKNFWLRNQHGPAETLMVAQNSDAKCLISLIPRLTIAHFAAAEHTGARNHADLTISHYMNVLTFGSKERIIRIIR